MSRPPQRYVFMLRFIGFEESELQGAKREEWEHQLASDAVGQLPESDGLMAVRSRFLEPAELAVYLQSTPLVAADFLGPVFAGLEVTLCLDDLCPSVSPAAREALAETGRLCGGPVVRTDDLAVRHPIDFVTYPAEELAAPDCFGKDILLRLPHSAQYEDHVHAAVRATLARAGVNVEYAYFPVRKDHVKLCFMVYPKEAKLWQALFHTVPSTAERLRGHEFRVVTYVPGLAEDAAFWRPADPVPSPGTPHA